MKPQVSKFMLEELERRAQCLEESDEEEGTREAETIRTGIEKITRGEKPDGVILSCIEEELRTMETMDRFWMDKDGRRQWLEASAWLGLLTKYPTPEQLARTVATGGKPRKIKIGDKFYEDWKRR
jgi:hypothetical protein